MTSTWYDFLVFLDQFDYFTKREPPRGFFRFLFRLSKYEKPPSLPSLGSLNYIFKDKIVPSSDSLKNDEGLIEGGLYQASIILLKIIIKKGALVNHDGGKFKRIGQVYKKLYWQLVCCRL